MLTDSTIRAVDVLVVGSGAAGMLAAIRGKDLKLSVALMEKSPYYGGTSAMSGGGIWVPAHDAIAHIDTPQAAFDYLTAASAGLGNPALLRAYIDHAPRLVRYLASIGVHYQAFPAYPDYLEELPGAGKGRSMLPTDMDGALLQQDFVTLRDAHPSWVAFGRYALNFSLARMLNKRASGWRRALLKMLWDYWSDVAWRLTTHTDRRLTWGRALVGGLRKAMRERQIPLHLGMELEDLGTVADGQRVVRFRRRGESVSVVVKQALVLACGGFEQNQALRDAWLPIRSSVAVSPTPAGGNVGDALRLGQGVGAAADHLSDAWWTPVIRFPMPGNSNVTTPYPLGNYRGRAHSLMVNRAGIRFANESHSYDQLAQEMIAEQTRSGPGPYWLIFDQRFRHSTPVGALLPSWSMPDRRVPPSWWNTVLFRADTIEGLARQIQLEPAVLQSTVERFNRFADAGVDADFHRGATYFDRYNGDATHAPNPCVGALRTPPYYAIWVEVGDLGTKGGLRTDATAQVLDLSNRPITGLYAVGNAAASPLVGGYPGGGGTLGPGMTFAMLAAEAIARSVPHNDGRLTPGV